MEQIHDPSFYQKLTFHALHLLMKNAAEMGHSKLDISNKKMGEPMKKELEKRGFIVSVSAASDYKTISW